MLVSPSSDIVVSVAFLPSLSRSFEPRDIEVALGNLIERPNEAADRFRQPTRKGELDNNR